jgi:diguanylate cyclase (GGDEF)-like protein
LSATPISSRLLDAFRSVGVTVEVRKVGDAERLLRSDLRLSKPDAAAEGHVVADRLRVTLAGVEHDLSLAVDLSEQVRLTGELIARSYYDELTGLPNRALVEGSVKALIEAGSDPFALAFIDLDDFKHINDCYGHRAGDELLSRVAERLTALLRPTDMLARVGGDELLLLLTPIADEEDLARDLRWLLERLKEPFYIDGQEIVTSASIGVAIYPRDGQSYQELGMNADRAMYSSKAGGKEGFRFFDASIAAAAAERHEMEQCLQRVLLDERIRCAYQPKFDFRNQQVAGVEVLMRWIDDDGFVQPPQRILQVANELGLMDEITSRIVEQTIASVDEINAAFGGSASISLNLSPQQAADFEFMRSLVNTLDRTGFADRFMLELTEEAFLAKQEFQSHILPLIRSVGARVSIDDFGVGYSSLASLAAITADEVKVDRSFITNVQLRARSQSILKAIEALGNSLGMSVVVEGVETEEELDYLRQRTGISVAQGYRFSKPVLLETSQLFPERTWQGRSLRRNRDVAPGRRCG